MEKESDTKGICSTQAGKGDIGIQDAQNTVLGALPSPRVSIRIDCSA